MSDRRRLASNGRVAAARLRGHVDAERFVEGAARQLIVPVADLWRAPGQGRDRQLIRGAGVTVYEERDGWAFVESAADGYVGYVVCEALGAVEASTHRVNVRACHVYAEADFKSPERESLSLGSLVRVVREEGRYAELSGGGYVPLAHLAALAPEADPVAVAERLVGTPYLWGGNSAFGIDCSGLVQMGCAFCGIDCPGDSDMQAAELGEALSEDAPLQRGDALFWKGHVAWVADETTLLHANAYHMAVAYEPIEAAIARIEGQGDGPVTGRRRVR